MKYLSICSGIEAATVAWHPLGWEPVAFAEIEKFPSAVLAHHYPHVPNLGDMTKFKEWPDADVDVLVGGTPCQSFSVAGLRKGMADPRGNLALTYLAIADRYRPEWLLWENVPGVLSSNGGRDFGAFLGGMVELGYGFAYRVLDAQYVRVDGFGRAVPQRRRRVFVVGNSRDWRRAAAVLFERESLSGNSAPRREAGQRVAPTISARPSGGGGLGTDFDCDGGLVPSISHCLNAGGMGRQDWETETVIAVAHALRGEGFDASEDGTGRGTPLVPVAFAENSRGELRLQGGDGQVSPQLTTGGGKPGQGQPCIAFSCKDSGGDASYNVSPTLRAGGFANSHANAGVMPAIAFTGGASDILSEEELAQPVTGRNGDPGMVQQSWAVRRLTPTECERLQGFPDGYTSVPYRGRLSEIAKGNIHARMAADGPRYKALGNSMAVNAMRWIGMRIELIQRTTLSHPPHHGEPHG